MTHEQPMDEALVEVTQADRDAAADYWRTFAARPGEFTVENQMRKGHMDELLAVQAFARHRLDAIAAIIPEGFQVVPVDDNSRSFSDSQLPEEMIEAGADVLERAGIDLANYVSGETVDWDYGMEAVAVYRAMLSAAPKPGER